MGGEGSADVSSGGDASSSSSTTSADTTGGSTSGNETTGSTTTSSSSSSSESSSTGSLVLPQCGDGVIEPGDLCFGDPIDLVAALGMSNGLFYPRVGHFNDDAHLDLAEYSSEASGAVALWFGDGNGSFDPTPEVVLAPDILEFDVADFDGDGLDDLVVRSDAMPSGLPTFRILRNLGAAGWEVSDDTHSDGFAVVVSAVEFDDDEFPDLLVVRSDDTAQVYLGDGAGMVGPASTALQLVQSPNHGDVETGDVTGDGRGDFVVMGGVFNAVQVIYRDEEDALGGAYFPFEVQGRSLTLADLDDDEHIDAVAVRSGELWAYRNNTNATFSILTTVDLADDARGVAAADFDQDGVQDVIVAGESATWFRGQGDFEFAWVDSVTLPDETARGYLRLADFNEDGVPDILVERESGLSLLLSDP